MHTGKPAEILASTTVDTHTELHDILNMFLHIIMVEFVGPIDRFGCGVLYALQSILKHVQSERHKYHNCRS